MDTKNIEQPLDEMLYYKDDSVKITNLRVTCSHVTIPIDKIDHVSSDLKINLLVASVTFFFLSALPFLWPHPWAWLVGCVWTVIAVVWLVQVFLNYSQLYVTVNGRKISLISTSMTKKEYVFKISEELARAVIQERTWDNDKSTIIRRASEPDLFGLSPSQTMVLRSMVKEYEKKHTGGSSSAPGAQENLSEDEKNKKDIE